MADLRAPKRLKTPVKYTEHVSKIVEDTPLPSITKESTEGHSRSSATPAGLAPCWQQHHRQHRAPEAPPRRSTPMKRARSRSIDIADAGAAKPATIDKSPLPLPERTAATTQANGDSVGCGTNRSGSTDVEVERNCFLCHTSPMQECSSPFVPVAISPAPQGLTFPAEGSVQAQIKPDIEGNRYLPEKQHKKQQYQSQNQHEQQWQRQEVKIMDGQACIVATDTYERGNYQQIETETQDHAEDRKDTDAKHDTSCNAQIQNTATSPQKPCPTAAAATSVHKTNKCAVMTFCEVNAHGTMRGKREDVLKKLGQIVDRWSQAVLKAQNIASIENCVPARSASTVSGSADTSTDGAYVGAVDGSCAKANFMRAAAESYACVLLEGGSYAMAVDTADSDLDICCCVPQTIPAQFFFGSQADGAGLVAVLRHTAGVSRLVTVVNAAVPRITFDLDGVEIDLLLAQLRVPRFEREGSSTVRSSLLARLDSDDILRGVDAASVAALSLPRFARRIGQLVPNIGVYRTALCLVRKWARARCIYGAKRGFLGGVSWAILVAMVSQRVPPHTSPLELVRCFFATFATWQWPYPVFLCPQYHPGDGCSTRADKEPFRVRQWDPAHNRADASHLMPIITPGFPSVNSAVGVTAAAKALTEKELRRGYEVFERLANGLMWCHRQQHQQQQQQHQQQQQQHQHQQQQHQQQQQQQQHQHQQEHMQQQHENVQSILNENGKQVSNDCSAPSWTSATQQENDDNTSHQALIKYHLCELCERVDFFGSYAHYISIDVSSVPSQEVPEMLPEIARDDLFTKWTMLVESRLRRLVQGFEVLPALGKIHLSDLKVPFMSNGKPGCSFWIGIEIAHPHMCSRKYRETNGGVSAQMSSGGNTGSGIDGLLDPVIKFFCMTELEHAAERCHGMTYSTKRWPRKKLPRALIDHAQQQSSHELGMAYMHVKSQDPAQGMQQLQMAPPPLPPPPLHQFSSEHHHAWLVQAQAQAQAHAQMQTQMQVQMQAHMQAQAQLHVQAQMQARAQAQVQAQAHVQTQAQTQVQTPAQARATMQALPPKVIAAEQDKCHVLPKTTDENLCPGTADVNLAPSRKTRRKRGLAGRLHKGQRDRLALRPTAKMNQH